MKIKPCRPNCDCLKCSVVRLLVNFLTIRNIKLDDGAMLLWLDGLHGMSLEEIENGIRTFNRESTEYPTPGAIRAAAGLSLSDRAETAWARVREAMTKHAGRRIVFEGDPAIHAALKSIGGWSQLCGGMSEQTIFKRAAFLKAYVTAVKRKEGDQLPLVGYVELNDDPVVKSIVEDTTPRLTSEPVPKRIEG